MRLVISPRRGGKPLDSAELAARFDQYFRHPNGSALVPTILPNSNGICSARQVLRGSKYALFSGHSCRFWEAEQNRFLSRPEIETLLDSPLFLERFQGGELLPATDSALLIVDIQQGSATLCSSSVGAAVFYYTIRDGYLIAADHMDLFAVARSDKLDPLGVGEVIRFGANYCERTLIETVKRVPFGHYLSIDRGVVGAKSSYVDFSYRPTESLEREPIKREIVAAIEKCFSVAGQSSAELLFSAGVDSSILGSIGSATGCIRRGWYMSLDPDDCQLETVIQAGMRGGFEVNRVVFDRSWEQLERAITAYSEPTLDYSILPTFQLVNTILAEAQPDFLVDGTGGDAWFGFGSLRHAKMWRRLHWIAKFLRGPSGYLFSRNLKRASAKWLFPMMVLARVPQVENPALGHMCANSAYRQMLGLSERDWSRLEAEIGETLFQLAPGNGNDDFSQVLVSDAAMIAVAQFAAKTGNYGAATTTQTMYPFLMPNVSKIARRLPAELMFEGKVSKPLLKEIARNLGYDYDYVYGKKRGFQPPLDEILRTPKNFESISYWVAEHVDDLTPLLTPFSKSLATRLLQGNERRLTIKSLYGVWGIIAIRVWLHNFRNGQVK